MFVNANRIRKVKVKMIPSMKMIREQQYEFLSDKKPHKLEEVVQYISNLWNLTWEEKRRFNTGSTEPLIKFRIRRNYELLMVNRFVFRPEPATFQATDFIDEWIKYDKHELSSDYIIKFKYNYPELMKKIRVIEKILSTNSCENNNRTIKNCKTKKIKFFDFLIATIIDYDVPCNRIREIIEFALELNYNSNNEGDIVPLI